MERGLKEGVREKGKTGGRWPRQVSRDKKGAMFTPLIREGEVEIYWGDFRPRHLKGLVEKEGSIDTMIEGRRQRKCCPRWTLRCYVCTALGIHSIVISIVTPFSRLRRVLVVWSPVSLDLAGWYHSVGTHGTSQ